MKKLYKKEGYIAKDGKKLSKEIEKALTPILKEWHKEGYDVNHIKSIVIDEVSDIILDIKLSI